MLGAATEVLDIHDGELEPNLENRKKITRLIRDWKADIVIAHRPWDYHPDHRYVGVLVQDAAYMVAVPHFCPDTPPLKSNPLFLYSSDTFQKPYRFKPDIVVALDDVIDQKHDAIHELESQLYEGGALGSEEQFRLVPKDAAVRKTWFKKEHYWSRIESRGRRSLPRCPRPVVWPRKGEGGQVRGSIRDVRVRPPRDATRDQEVLPVLRVIHDAPPCPCRSAGVAGR